MLKHAWVAGQADANGGDLMLELLEIGTLNCMIDTISATTLTLHYIAFVTYHIMIASDYIEPNRHSN